jgi:hypothetical protein
MAATKNAPRSEPGTPLVPPDESMWRKYSRHHEFPISTIMSVVLHLFTIVTIALFGAILFNWGGSPPPEVDNVEFAGGGGSGQGGGEETPTLAGKEAVAEQVDPTEGINFDAVDLTKIDTPRNIEEARKAQELVQGIRTKAAGPEGRGGPGSGGGKGSGIGTGEGSGMGPGKGSARQRRAERWAISFSYQSADEYIQYYASLGAILLVRESDTSFRVFRDLSKKPYEGKVEALSELNRTNKRVYYVTQNQQDLRAAQIGLPLEKLPQLVAIFIPPELETEMGKKELEYKGLSLKEIEQRNMQTTFQISRAGDKYDIRVVSQRPG